MKLYNNLYISENNQQNVASPINYNTIIENFLKIKTLNKIQKKMAHSLKKYLVNPTYKILKIKIYYLMFTNEKKMSMVH